MEGHEVLPESADRLQGWLGRLSGETGGLIGLPLNATTNGSGASLVVKSGAGVLYGFTALNFDVAARFVVVLDITPPFTGNPGTAVAVPIAAGGGATWNPGAHGRTFLQGCVLVLSTSGAFAVSAGNNGWFDAQYV